MDLKEIAQFLDDNAPAFLATLGTCGNPRVRPIQSPLLVGDKIYFCTANTKGLFKHIKNYNDIEFCSCAKDGTFLRLRANAVFEPNFFKKFYFIKFHLTTLKSSSILVRPSLAFFKPCSNIV